MKFFPSHLRARLLLIACVAALPAIAAIVYMQAAERRVARDRALADNLRVARLAASQQAGVIDGARRLLLTLAEFPPMRAESPGECNDLLPRVLRDHPGYFNLTVANRDGWLFCSALPLDPRLLGTAKGRAWFERAVDTRSSAIGDYQLSATTGKPAIVVAHPLLDASGKVVRVVAATIGLNQLNQIAAQADLPRGAAVALFDRHRTVLARFPEGDRWVGQKLPETWPLDRLLGGASDDVADTVGVDGVRRMYVTVPVRASIDTGMYLAMGIDHDTAFREVNRAFRRYLWLIALVSLSVVAIAILAGQRLILAPIKAVKTVTDRLAAGDLSARAQLADTVSGVSELGEAVNAMATALDARQRERDRAEQELRQSEDRYRLLFDQNPHSMWVYDLATLEFLEVNEAAVRVYGYSRAEFLRMRLTEIRPIEDVPRLAARIASNREPWARSTGWRHRLKSGEIIDVDITSHTLTFAGRHAALVTAQDVTDRTKTEAALDERTSLTALTADVGVALNRPQPLRECLGGCARAAVARLDLAGVHIWTTNQTGALLELEGSAGTYTPPDATDRGIAVGEGAIGRVGRNGLPYFSNEAAGDAGVDDQEGVLREGLAAFAAYPLLVESRVVGVMAIFARRPLSDAILTSVAATADLIALGIERHRGDDARRLLSAIVEGSDDAIIGKTLDGTIVSWNAGAERLYGYPASEAIGRHVSLLGPEGRAQEPATLLERVRTGADVKQYETVRRHKNGSLVPVSLTLSPIKDAAGEIRAVSVIARDIGNVQRAAQTLRESEERFRLIAETITQVFWITDVHTETTIYISPAYEQVWGRSCESLYNDSRSFLETVHPDDRERVVDELRVQQDGEPFGHEYRIVRPDGEVRWIWDRGFPVRNQTGRVFQYVGVAEDITERRATEDRIRLLARALESTNEMVSVTDVHDRFTFVNSAFLRAYGYAAEEIIGRTPELVWSPTAPDAVLEDLRRESRRNGWKGELMNRRKDGSEFCINLNTSSIRDDRGEIVGLLGVAGDITERLLAERALRDAEERMRFALDAARVGVWELNLRTRESYWSGTCEQMHGSEPGTFENTFDAFLTAIHPDDRQRALDAVAQATAAHTNLELEYRTVWPDGTEHRISSVGQFFYDAAGAAVRGAGVAIDVTGRHLLEEQLRQSQKMDAIGQLAGGIAHDFNNLLTAILGFAGILAESIPESDVRRADVEEIRHAANRAAALTRQLLAFSRKQILAVRVLNLGDVVADLTPMLRRLLGESIDVRTTIGERGLVKADPGQIEQVIVNLGVNAHDAMREGGRLTIETADVVLDEAFARHHPSVRPGPHVMLTVSDTGHGMDAATGKRIFEPFFTTKPQGQGTGLGLATVYGIVKQSGGSIWMSSEIDQGTTFKIYLPRTDEVEEIKERAPAATSARGGTETILLVEDEDLVRGYVQRVLTAKGYTVHAMSDPKRAIEFAETWQGKIDLVFTDVILPDMSGRTMITQLQQGRPESKVLYMSGYDDHAIVHRGVLESGTAFLPKPFTADALARKVREVLDGQSPART